MNKRGIFFTTITLVILSLLIVSYAFYSGLEERRPIQKRITTLNNFISSAEKDLERQIYIGGYRAILSINSHITKEGVFISSSESSITEAMINGTIESQAINLMEGYTLKDFNNRMSQLGDKLNIIVNYTITNLTIKQEDPWSVKITATINLSARDKSNLASWNKIEDISSKIEISEFEDPLYLVKTNGLVTNKIIRTPYESFVQGENYANLSIHIENSYYIASSQGPSFLDRLEGKTSSNEEGIESIVNLQEFIEKGISIQSKSGVDYIYFSDNNPTSCEIEEVASWLKLDEAHLSIYQVSC